MNPQYGALAEAANATLARNRVGAWTKPAPRLYPHLWSWDSAFLALGRRHLDPEGALAELTACLRGQWSSGMVPHIRYDTGVEGQYFPSWDLWDSAGAGAELPPGLHTSGIMQPPVHAITASALHAQDLPVEDEVFWRCFEWHRYLMGPRDPDASGGITILHPWESGLDNSPRWDQPLRAYRLEERPTYQRLDQDKVENPEDRPLDEDYDRYVDLLLRLKAAHYRPAELQDDYPFRVKDVAITSIFAAANRDLIELAKRFGHRSEAAELTRYQNRVLGGFDQLFRWPNAWEEHHWYADRCLVSGSRLEVLTCAGALALLAGIDSIEDPEGWATAWLDGPFHTPDRKARLWPSTAPGVKGYEPRRYWRGPAWINIQWLIARGLGPSSKLAAELRDESLGLLAERGLWEYFDLTTGDGCGADEFSWSAALALDWMHC